MKEAKTIQRAEGLAIFLAATTVYFYSDFSILLYIIFLLVFDIFMLGYLINNKIGAISYNIGHSLIAPSLLVLVFLVTDSRFILSLTCLWFAHVGIDRAFGYGLKLSKGFKHTHLGEIGKK
jgi:hypothetical protein